VHARLDHAEEEGLDDAVETVVLGLGIGRFEVGEDGLADDGAKRRGYVRK
jgi:hypothetical protein